MKFYIGLTYCQFLVLFSFLGSAVDNLIYWGRERKHVELGATPTKRRSSKRIMTSQNELILTLISLRLGLLHKQLAYMFDISETQVVSSSHGSDSCMYGLQFKRMDRKCLPSASQMKKKFPLCFKQIQNIILL